MRKLIDIMYHLVFYLSVFVLVVASVIAFTARFTVPGGFGIYSVLTGSMNPTIPTGALIINKIPSSTQDIAQGNIITFIEPGFRNKFITHRVYKVITQGKVTLFQTKGDANKTPDPWRIAYGSIKGVYQIDFPYLGYFLEFLKSPLGIIIFVFIPLAIIALAEIRNIFNILFEMRLQKENVKQENTNSGNHLLILSVFVLGLSLLTCGSSNSYALFKSEPVTIQGSIIATAKSFPTPSPTPCPTNNTTITISGNGAGSVNTVNVTNTNNTTTTQSNNTTDITNITSITNTGNNVSSNNTGDNTTIISSSAASIINILNKTGSNSATIK